MRTATAVQDERAAGIAAAQAEGLCKAYGAGRLGCSRSTTVTGRVAVGVSARNTARSVCATPSGPSPDRLGQHHLGYSLDHHRHRPPRRGGGRAARRRPAARAARLDPLTAIAES